MKRRHAEPARLGGATHDAEVRGGHIITSYAGAMGSEMDDVEANARACLKDLPATDLSTVETPEPNAISGMIGN